MAKTITSAGILSRVYNSRALITDNFDNKTTVRDRDGGLWCVLKENKEDESINLYYSDNNGFEWYWLWSGDLENENIRYSFPNVNTQGPHLNLQIFNDINILIIWHGYKNDSDNKYHAQPFLFNIADPFNIIRAEGETFPTEYTMDADFTLDGSNNEKSSYLSFIKDGSLNVSTFSPTNITNYNNVSNLAGNYFNLFSSVADPNSFVDHAVLSQVGSSQRIVHSRYFETYGHLPEQEIYTAPEGANISELSISKDAHGTMIVAWGEQNTAGSDIDVCYALSKGGLITNVEEWTDPVLITKSTGHSAFREDLNLKLRTRVTTLAGRSGFLISYVRNTSIGVHKVFVRHITTDDEGLTYTLGEEKETATRITHPEDNVVGLRFFKPAASEYMDISDPGKVSIALQIGEGNSDVQNDIVPIRIAQESLSSSAYPFTEDDREYVDEIGDENNLLVDINVLGGPSENIDYYAVGLIGAYTEKYISSFNRIGTTVELFKYEPVIHTRMNDTTAYRDKVSCYQKAIIEPMTYQFPLNQGSESQPDYVERDIRKVYFPPNFHLSRNFLVNDGNFFKRTVWTMTFDGNEYELSQVVPYFIENEIAYYSANAYVIGPGNDPFSKRTLPSET